MTDHITSNHAGLQTITDASATAADVGRMTAWLIDVVDPSRTGPRLSQRFSKVVGVDTTARTVTLAGGLAWRLTMKVAADQELLEQAFALRGRVVVALLLEPAGMRTTARFCLLSLHRLSLKAAIEVSAKINATAGCLLKKEAG